jgi:hypothetical protein
LVYLLGHFVYFVAIGNLVYFSRFGMLYQEKSGNPVLITKKNLFASNTKFVNPETEGFERVLLLFTSVTNASFRLNIKKLHTLLCVPWIFFSWTIVMIAILGKFRQFFSIKIDILLKKFCYDQFGS